MPSFNINDCIINKNYWDSLKNKLNTCDTWVEYKDGLCDVSNIKQKSQHIVNNITNSSYLLNKFFSTLFLTEKKSDIIPRTFYLVNSRWLNNEPSQESTEWIIKDVYDYNTDNSKIYSSLVECTANAHLDKYYVVQPYINTLVNIRCYVLLFRNKNKTQFYLFKDGYLNYSDNQSYERFNDYSQYDKTYKTIYNHIQSHLSSLQNSLNKKSDDIREFQLFEYVFGITYENKCYLLNNSMQLSIFEQNNKVFNILSDVIINDIVNELLIPTINKIKCSESEETAAKIETETNDEITSECEETKVKTDSETEMKTDPVRGGEIDAQSQETNSECKETKKEKVEPDEIIMNNDRWDKIDLIIDNSDTSELFLDIIEKSKINLKKMTGTFIQNYYFENVNSNNILFALNKILEASTNWNESRKETYFSDTANSNITYGMKLEHHVNLSNINTLLPEKYIPEIHMNCKDLKPSSDIWHIKNVFSDDIRIVKYNKKKPEFFEKIKDDFIVVDNNELIVYQKEIPNLMLINNRKFIIKMYCLLSTIDNKESKPQSITESHEKSMTESGVESIEEVSTESLDDSVTESVQNGILFKDGIMLCASQKYENNTKIEIHSFKEKHAKQNDISNNAIHFSDWNKYNELYPKIKEIINKLLSELYKNNSLDTNSCQLIEVDFAVDNENNLYIVDIQYNPVIVNDKRLWILSIKNMLQQMLKDVMDMIVSPVISGNQFEVISRWDKII